MVVTGLFRCCVHSHRESELCMIDCQVKYREIVHENLLSLKTIIEDSLGGKYGFWVERHSFSFRCRNYLKINKFRVRYIRHSSYLKP